MSLDEITNSESSSTISPSSFQEPDDYIQRSIYYAIVQNNVEELTKILNDNPSFDINKPLRELNEEKFKSDQFVSDGDYKNALMIACSLDCVDIVRYLLSRTNINIDLQGNYRNIFSWFHLNTIISFFLYLHLS
jgi:hypothetical protein